MKSLLLKRLCPSRGEKWWLVPFCLKCYSLPLDFYHIFSLLIDDRHLVAALQAFPSFLSYFHVLFFFSSSRTFWVIFWVSCRKCSCILNFFFPQIVTKILVQFILSLLYLLNVTCCENPMKDESPKFNKYLQCVLFIPLFRHTDFAQLLEILLKICPVFYSHVLCVWEMSSVTCDTHILQ